MGDTIIPDLDTALQNYAKSAEAHARAALQEAEDAMAEAGRFTAQGGRMTSEGLRLAQARADQARDSARAWAAVKAAAEDGFFLRVMGDLSTRPDGAFKELARQCEKYGRCQRVAPLALPDFCKRFDQRNPYA